MQLLDSQFTDNSLFTISKPIVAQTLFESAFLLDQPIIYKRERFIVVFSNYPINICLTFCPYYSHFSVISICQLLSDWQYFSKFSLT